MDNDLKRNSTSNLPTLITCVVSCDLKKCGVTFFTLSLTINKLHNFYSFRMKADVTNMSGK